jgi:predicted HAD superfamily Cof-like phosphohydrolase
MKQQIEQLKQWCSAIDVPVPDKLQMLSDERIVLRYTLMSEENEEYVEAETETELADALGDMLYVLVGTILEHGMHHKIEEVFSEIHRSNMTKVVDGKVVRRRDGKILKPETYEKPNIESILKGGEQ